MEAPADRSKWSTLSALGGAEACGARWTLGTLLLAPLAAVNFSYCSVLAVIVLAASITFSTITCQDLKKLSETLPPPKTARGRRERNLRSFADFMAIWMTFLSHLVAVAVCARILSATADHVTEGRTRRWLFGYETRALGEPWPDVLGVTVVLVVCAMFMCGLEESLMFTFMLLVLLYVFSQFFAIFGLINLDIANINMPLPITAFQLLSAGSPIAYAFNVVSPTKERGNSKRDLLLMILLPMIVLSSLCFLYTNMLKGSTIDAALPVTTLIETRASSWVCPLLAAITVLGVSLAITELCPLLFTILVALASTEWKVLTRSLTYESTATGSPVLAVFTAGSLAAILAFACPLSHMITLMNASHLLGIAIQALHFIIMRCVPTAEQIEAGDVEYKRLGTAGPSRPKSATKKQRKGLWFIPSAIRHTKTLESIKSKVIKETEERECLLLDEYSGCQPEDAEPASSVSNITGDLGVNEEVHSDADIPSEIEMSSGDDSTDIDAVVKEYRDTIQVVTATPEAVIPIPPSVRGARFAAFGALVQLVADAFIATALSCDKLQLPMFAAGIPLWICGTGICAWQPSHKLGLRKWQWLYGPISMLTSILFLTPLLLDSWPAIILFAGAGVVIYARCERWCGDLAVQQARTALDRKKLPVSVPVTAEQLAHFDAVYITR